MDEQFSTLLKEIMQENGILNSALAKHLHTTPQYVSKYTTGMNIPNKAIFARIVEYLMSHGMSEDYRARLINCYVEDRCGYKYDASSANSITLNSSELELLKLYRLLASDDKEDILKQVSALLSKESERKSNQ